MGAGVRQVAVQGPGLVLQAPAHGLDKRGFGQLVNEGVDLLQPARAHMLHDLRKHLLHAIAFGHEVLEVLLQIDAFAQGGG